MDNFKTSKAEKVEKVEKVGKRIVLTPEEKIARRLQKMREASKRLYEKKKKMLCIKRYENLIANCTDEDEKIILELKLKRAMMKMENENA